MTPETARDELVRLQVRLDQVRRRLHDDPSTRTRTPEQQLGDQSLWIYPAAGLMAVAGFGLIIAVTSFMGESTTALVVGLAVTLVAGVPAVHLLRTKVITADRRRRQPLIALQQARLDLLAEVDAVYAALGSQRPASGAEPIALPSSRQPRRWPELMADRFRFGRRPEAALRRLPDDASRAAVWYHRHLGDSGLMILTVAAAILVPVAVLLAVGQ